MVLIEASTAERTTSRIEPLLSSRLFLAPQLVGDRLFFISNLGGAFSLYAMDRAGSVPEPLLPPDIALQNPELVPCSFYVFPDLEKIVVMIDHDGDENYQPMVVPIDGGIPEPAFGQQFARYRCHLARCYPERNALYLAAESRERSIIEAYAANLESGELTKLAESQWFSFPAAAGEDGSRVILIDQYTFGDAVLFLWERDRGERHKLYGTTIEEQPDRSQVTFNGISSAHFTRDDRGLLLLTSLFEDTYGLGYLELAHPEEVHPVRTVGSMHTGVGEMVGVEHMRDSRYSVSYNIDGVSWLYEGTFDEDALEMRLEPPLVGEGRLANGTVEQCDYDETSDRFTLSFSSATSPTQLYVLEALDQTPQQLTRERILGIPEETLSPGEDLSFTSFDGLRISARLYLPSEATGHTAPYPLVYYIHGGPQGQERPDFAWFSMPLIQFLTLNGFAVFVPNARGSTGYGQRYMKLVDRDWGGNDRLDHVHAMTEVLPQDPRLDTTRAGVMGRSYGGYMTLTLASRHPHLWSGAVDMFGPYNLLSFIHRLPETWKPYFKIAVGDPETEEDFLLERSPCTYIEQVQCPMLVIQGRNDPRVIEQESRDVVETLRAAGREVEYLVFENEGHDVLKYENRVRCYTAIRDFFKQRLTRDRLIERP